MKKILFFAGIALLAASCTEDYADWAGLQRNAAEEAKTVTMKVTPTAGDINLAAAGDSVQLFAPSVAISDEATTTFNVNLTTGEEGSSVVSLVADNAGRVLKSELQDAVVSFYGARPVPRAISMAIAAYTMINGQSIKNVASGTLSVIPEAPEVELLDDVVREQVPGEGGDGAGGRIGLTGKEVLDHIQATGLGRGLGEGTEDGIGEPSQYLVLDICGDIHLGGGCSHNLLD